MIPIKPHLRYHSECPYCGAALQAERFLWQGIHSCVVARCPGCAAEIIEDLGVGQALFSPYQVDLKKDRIFGDESALDWFGLPLLRSLQHPREEGIELKVERFFSAKRVVILNCIDFLYGHSLLKLLNAGVHLEAGAALVVLVPSFLRWMVPEGVAEIWVVDLPLRKALSFYPELERAIEKECERFEEIHLSLAHSHPRDFDIFRFTGVRAHDFSREPFRITFVWREDRLWWRSRFTLKVLRKAGLGRFLIARQRDKVVRFFGKLRFLLPQARFTVVGISEERNIVFPDWIEDCRLAIFDEKSERRACEIYAESRLVIGIHGSNMLLPSAHAGLTLDLMPEDRWSNFIQDLLYHERDPRLASFRYRCLPLETDLGLLSRIAFSQLSGYTHFRKQMLPGSEA
ncbi:MAG TPA: hypothetical protein V6C82_03730 [Chroococcales cyanobacterium]